MFITHKSVKKCEDVWVCEEPKTNTIKPNAVIILPIIQT